MVGGGSRAEALQVLASIGRETGMSISPIVGTDVSLVILWVDAAVDTEQAQWLSSMWPKIVKGTSLEGARTVVMQRNIHLEVRLSRWRRWRRLTRLALDGEVRWRDLGGLLLALGVVLALAAFG